MFYLDINDRALSSTLIWSIIITVGVLSLVILTILHLRIREQEEILRMRPVNFLITSLLLVTITLIITGLKKFIFHISYDIIYYNTLFMCVSFFYLFFYDTVVFLLSKSENSFDGMVFIIKKHTKFRKIMIISMYAFTFAGIIEKVVCFYTEWIFLNIVFLLEFATFLLIFVIITINLAKHRSDTVGLKSQISYLGVSTILFPIFHYITNLNIDTDTLPFIALLVGGSFLEISMAHMVGLIQIGYPYFLVMRDKYNKPDADTETNTEVEENGTSSLRHLLTNTLFIKYFTLYLDLEYSVHHMHFYMHVTRLINLIESTLAEGNLTEEGTSRIMEEMITLIRKYIGDEDSRINESNISNMFGGHEGGAQEAVNITNKLKTRLRQVKDRLEKPSFFELLNPKFQRDIIETIKSELIESEKQTFGMLRSSRRRYMKHPLYKEYLEAAAAE